jgi:hypothetical protein
MLGDKGIYYNDIKNILLNFTPDKTKNYDAYSEKFNPIIVMDKFKKYLLINMKIKEFTICLHCGCSIDVVNNQMNALKPLEEKYKIFWNNRINRYPESYNSYSELINDSVVSSPTEFVILINDRTKPKAEEVEHMIELLENGFAAVTKYSVGFMGFSKQLLRKIGFWDERFYGGGYEDDDFVLRLKLANLAYYESEEAEYDQSWKSQLFPQDGIACSKSYHWFITKWNISPQQITKVIQEENYEKYKDKLGDNNIYIEKNWKDWNQSKIGIMFNERKLNNNGGESRTHWFLMEDYKTEYRKVSSNV